MKKEKQILNIQLTLYKKMEVFQMKPITNGKDINNFNQNVVTDN